MADELVLSTFPGIDLLGMAFEHEGYTVVRGPDVMWGGDVKTFHPPAGRFDGLIGGPPCQFASRMRHLNPNAGAKHGNLIPEFERCVFEAQPTWFLMENVEDAPLPVVAGYIVRAIVMDNRWVGAEQQRRRRFSFGTRDGRALDVEVALFESPLIAQAVTSSASAVPVKLGGSGKVKATYKPPTVTGGHGAPFSHERGDRTFAEMCRLQGLPEDFLSEAPFTAHGKRKVVGNGVPLPMGRAIARAVRRATEPVRRTEEVWLRSQPADAGTPNLDLNPLGVGEKR